MRASRSSRATLRPSASGATLRTDHWSSPLRRDLRQVRDAQHLALLAELAQRPADGLGHRAADAGVDLVEHQRADRRGLAATSWIARLMRDSSPPEATLRERPQRQARVRRDLELDLLGARRRPARSSAFSATAKRPPAIASCCIAGGDRLATAPRRRALRFAESFFADASIAPARRRHFALQRLRIRPRARARRAAARAPPSRAAALRAARGTCAPRRAAPRCAPRLSRSASGSRSTRDA